MANGSVNLYKSFTYAQPETYHFSHDSVFLARKAFEAVRDEKINADHVLDLCSGCGVVGLDFAFHLASEENRLPSSLDFVDVQNIYEPFLTSNIATFKSLVRQKAPCRILFENYANLHTYPELKGKYDLILCNPPYFRIGQGRLSPSDFKNRCRFFIDSGYPDLIKSMHYLLKPGGSVFLLMQSLQDHNVDVYKETENLGLFHIFNRGLIRATDFYQLVKPYV